LRSSLSLITVSLHKEEGQTKAHSDAPVTDTVKMLILTPYLM